MNNILNTIDSIRTRRTVKVISETALPIKPRDDMFIEQLMTAAYYAPHHYPCFAGHKKHLASPLPWRFYVLDSENCRRLAAQLVAAEQGGKIIGMLNTADYLFQATWCPSPAHQSEQQSLLFNPSVVNMEHIAGASAAVQNLLLTATALGHENYWSSGGPLREAFVFDLLEIPAEEILLGSLFIFPVQDSVADDVAYLPSKRRDQRGSVQDSYRMIEL